MDKEFKRKFLKGSASTLLGQVSSMIFHFISIIILARVLPKDDFGIYALIILTAYFFIVVSGLGLDVTLVKFISSEELEEKKTAFSKIFLFKVLSLSFFLILFLLLGGSLLSLVDNRLPDFKFFIAALFFLGGFRDLFYRVLQGINYFNRYAITQVAAAFIKLSLIILLYTIGNLNLVNLVAIEVIAVLGVIAIELIFIPFKDLYNRKLHRIKTKTLFNFSLPVYLNNLTGFATTRINVFILGVLLNPVSVAYFDVANKIPEALRRIFNSFILVFYPNLSKLFSNHQYNSAKELISKSLNIFSVLLTFAVLISFLFRNEIISLFFSEKYVESSVLFSLLMLNFTFFIFRNILGYSNLSAGYPKVPMIVNIVASVISISGSLIMIPMYGYIAVAYSLIIMDVTSQTLYLLYLKKIDININVLRYLKPIILLFITVALYLILDDHSLSIRLISILFFITLSWFFISDFKTLLLFITKYIFKFNSS